MVVRRTTGGRSGGSDDQSSHSTSSSLPSVAPRTLCRLGRSPRLLIRRPRPSKSATPHVATPHSRTLTHEAVA